MVVRIAGRRPAVALAPLFVAYLAVALAAQPGPGPTRDEGPLLVAAHRLLHGGYAAPHAHDPTLYLWHGPGLPLVLAPFVAAGVPLWLLRGLGALLLFTAIVMFARLLRLRLGPRAALAGAYALGFYPPSFSLLPWLHKETLALALVTAAAYGIARALRDGSRRHLLLAGAALGGLALTRLEYGWVTIVALGLWAAAWAWSRGRSARAGRMAIVALVALATCAPWLAYTQALTGRTLYWGNSGGLSLYWMSNSRHLGEWRSPETVRSDPALAAERPLFRRLDALAPVARDEALRRIALRHIRTAPLDYARNVAANFTRMWFGAPFSVLPTYAAVLYGLLNGMLALALLAAAVALVRRRRAYGRGSLPAEAAPLALLGILGLGVHLIPSAEPRMLMPLIPLALWPIVFALGTRRARFRHTTHRPPRRPTVIARRVGPGAHDHLDGTARSVRGVVHHARP